MTNQQNPYALELAQEYRVTMPASVLHLWAADARDTLHRMYAENAALQQGYDAARLEIDSFRARVQELEAQISKPAGEYPPLPEPDASTVGLGAVWNRHSMRAYADAARAMQTQTTPTGKYLPLPVRYAYDDEGNELFSAAQMFNYVDADRAMRTQAAPAAVAGPSDDEILALNAGEIHFSESPSKYPWAGHGTQYHAGAPGVLSFARAVLARWGAAPTTQAAPQQEAQEP